MEYAKMSLSDLLKHNGFQCACGKVHSAGVEQVIIESGALKKIPGLVCAYGAKRPFILSDVHTEQAAGEKVKQLLNDAGIPFSSFIFQEERVEPDERAVGLAVMKFDPACDLVISVGSGVMNDIGKILSNVSGRPYFIVGTAPSMDGYASATSSVVCEGLKVSLNSRFANVVLGDLDVLCQAPMHMICAGIGDMVAKYVSICEWRLAQLIVGEYYCETVAGMVRNALTKCMKAIPGLTRREPEAVAAVMEGMVLGGMAMKYAGLSRPASGVEHYFSHIWDMRAQEFGTACDLHGIQCGVATLLALRVYDEVKKLTPDREKAQAGVKAFSLNEWNGRLEAFLGRSAQAMIRGEQREGKYDPEKHAARLPVILDNWDEIQRIIREELPEEKTVRDALKAIGAPLTPRELGLSAREVHDTFLMTKDIRDKYVVSRLLWDLGVLDEVADRVFPV